MRGLLPIMFMCIVYFYVNKRILSIELEPHTPSGGGGWAAAAARGGGGGGGSTLPPGLGRPLPVASGRVEGAPGKMNVLELKKLENR